MGGKSPTAPISQTAKNSTTMQEEDRKRYIALLRENHKQTIQHLRIIEGNARGYSKLPYGGRYMSIYDIIGIMETIGLIEYALRVAEKIQYITYLDCRMDDEDLKYISNYLDKIVQQASVSLEKLNSRQAFPSAFKDQLSPFI